ncbi:hypothetical protein PR048_006254 [Dryococelus australis]|uniref:Uncharacterized protein n=1 Tax=Dryococelus australis TaxID=614101 RepID=A0ABQ9IAG5_9NEOP|nr:hypothetical protein PR048_006254 [Dryococelus australis]
MRVTEASTEQRQNGTVRETEDPQENLQISGFFLLIYRKANAGELEEDSGLSKLAKLTEINVEEVGVGGAKNFFEAKHDLWQAVSRGKYSLTSPAKGQIRYGAAPECKSRGNRRCLRKPTNQQHSHARFLHAKIWKSSRQEVNLVHLGERRIEELNKSSKFEEEIRQEQEERKRQEEEKERRRVAFKQKAALFQNGNGETLLQTPPNGTVHPIVKMHAAPPPPPPSINELPHSAMASQGMAPQVETLTCAASAETPATRKGRAGVTLQPGRG